MSTDLQTPPEQQNMTALLTGILNDAQELFRQQLSLVRSEIQEDLRKTKEALVPTAIGFCLALLGILLLSVAVAVGLGSSEAGLLPLWAGFTIVGGILAVIGGVLSYVGWAKFASFNPLPDKSAEALKENVEWLTKPK